MRQVKGGIMVKKNKNLNNNLLRSVDPNEERRNIERKDLSTPIKASFSLEFEGEILDISKDGIAFKFHPLKTASLDAGKSLRIHLNMNDRIVSLQGEIRRITEKFGFLTVGLKYNRDEIALFNFKSQELSQKENPESNIPVEASAIESKQS
jgi:hypothetical protein